MTALVAPRATGTADRLLWTLRDSWTLTRRELDQLRHQPGELLGAVIFPGLMVLMFGYVFGSAISIPGGGNYREYLMPGLFAMVTLMTVMSTAVLVSKDVAEGVMDRLRSMPTSRLAVPFGRAILDLIMCFVALVIMVVIGLLVGWRAHLGIAHTAAGFGLLVLMRFALTWVGITIGMSLKPATADAMVPLVFPVSILSNGFVPVGGLPAWLRVIVEWNPVTALVQSCRRLFGNPGAVADSSVFPLAHPYLMTVGSALLLLAIFIPLAVRKFARATD